MQIPDKIKPLHQKFNWFSQRGYTTRNVFEDFLDILIYTFSCQKYEDKFAKLIEKYSKEEKDKFAEIFAWLVPYLENNQFSDPLGDFYQYTISNGAMGQFFTPTHICEMMAELVGTDQSQVIIDPTCGSGRLVLAGLKVARKNNHQPFCFGADLDKTCVKMATVNLIFYGVDGEVACMDSITNKFFFSYKLAPLTKGGLEIIEKQGNSKLWQTTTKKMSGEIQDEKTELLQQILF